MPNSQEVIAQLDLMLAQINELSHRVNEGAFNGGMKVIKGVGKFTENVAYHTTIQSKSWWESEKEYKEQSKNLGVVASVAVGVPVLAAAGMVSVLNSLKSNFDVKSTLFPLKNILNQNLQFAKTEAIPVLKMTIEQNTEMLVRINAFEKVISRADYTMSNEVDLIISNLLDSQLKLTQIGCLEKMVAEINTLCSGMDFRKNEQAGLLSKLGSFLKDTVVDMIDSPKVKLNKIIENYYNNLQRELIGTIYEKLIAHPSHNNWLTQDRSFSRMPLVIGKLSSFEPLVEYGVTSDIYRPFIEQKDSELANIIPTAIYAAFGKNINNLWDWNKYIEVLEKNRANVVNFAYYDDLLKYLISNAYYYKQNISLFEQQGRSNNSEQEFYDMVESMDEPIKSKYLEYVVNRNLQKLKSDNNILALYHNGFILYETNFSSQVSQLIEVYRSNVWNAYYNQSINSLFNKSGWTMNSGAKFLSLTERYFPYSNIGKDSRQILDFLEANYAKLEKAEEMRRTLFGHSKGNELYSQIYSYAPAQIRECIDKRVPLLTRIKKLNP